MDVQVARDRKSGKWKQLVKIHGVAASDIALTEKQALKLIDDLKLGWDRAAKEKSYMVYKQHH